MVDSIFMQITSKPSWQFYFFMMGRLGCGLAAILPTSLTSPGIDWLCVYVSRVLVSQKGMMAVLDCMLHAADVWLIVDYAAVGGASHYAELLIGQPG